MAAQIHLGGGKVAGAVLFADASRNGIDGASNASVRKIKGRFGDAIREQFGVEPDALTASEAAYVLNFANADALRTTGSKAGREKGKRLGGRTAERKPDLGEQTRPVDPAKINALLPALRKRLDKMILLLVHSAHDLAPFRIEPISERTHFAPAGVCYGGSMDKKEKHLVREYYEARQKYLRAKVRLLEHMLRQRRARRARGPQPIELEGYDNS